MTRKVRGSLLTRWLTDLARIIGRRAGLPTSCPNYILSFARIRQFHRLPGFLDGSVSLFRSFILIGRQ